MTNEMKRIANKLRDHEFICLGTIKPDYADNKIIDLKDKKNKEDLKRKILNIRDIDDINIYEAAKNIRKQDLEKYFEKMSLKAEELENNQKRIIKNLEQFNNVFDKEIEKALIKSVFEYKIINIFVIDKDSNKYQSEKINCQNTEVKILFHGTNIDSITWILSTQFNDAKVHIFGKGVYFTDILDYACYYAGENYRENFYFIPKVGDTFSIVANEIYYNKSKKKTVYDVQTRDKEVEKDGIRLAYVNYNTKLMGRRE